MKNTSRFLKLLSLILIVLFSLFAIAEDKSNVDCSAIGNEIESRISTLSKMHESLDSLMGSGTVAEVPLTVLFQVDLTNVKQINERKKELKRLSSSKVILSSLEFKKYLSCTIDDSDKVISNLSETQAQINSKKLAFLELEEDKRETLAATYQAKRKTADDQFALQTQLLKSQTALESAQSELMKSEEETSKQNDSDTELILVAKSSIDKFLVGLESEHIDFIGKLKDKKEKLDNLQEELSKVSKNYYEAPSSRVSSSYLLVSNIWETAVDQLLELFSNIKLQSGLNRPEPISIVPATEAGKKSFAEYLLAKDKASDRIILLTEAKTKALNALKVQNFKLLQDSGSLRAKLLHKCDSINCERPRGLNEKNIGIILREVRVVPLRLVAGGLTKWLEIKSKFASGIDGWINIVKQLFVFFLLLLIPIILIKSLRWTSLQLDQLKKNLLLKSMMNYRSRTNLAVWISRLNPFVPSVGMIISIGAARELIKGTDLKELAFFLYYFQIFYVFRSAKLLLMIGLELVFSTDSVEALRLQKSRIESSAGRISRLIFIEYVILHFTQDTVRKALVYQLLSNIIFWVNVAFVILEAIKWREEISYAFSERFPKIWPRFKSLYQAKLGKIFLPLMFVAVVVHDIFGFISSYLVRIDFVKRLLSEVLRKRLERAEKGSKTFNPPPTDYLASFDYYLSANDNIFVEREDSILNQASEDITSWINNETTDDLLIIVGNRGMGKTTTIDHIQKRLKGNCDTILEKVPSKVLTVGDFYQWFSKYLNHPVNSLDDVLTYDKTLERKCVFCIDDIQNFFLGVIGGFDAYRTFLEVISLKTSNMYWCLTVNSRSWAYLKGVLGEEHFYGKELYLHTWKDFEIQKLILSRHEITKYKRTFDDSIKAYGAGDSLGEQAESHFFRLLWGQSRGNPRSALMYWVSAISTPGEGRIHVGIPSFVNSGLVGSMSDDAHFLLSAIARHESLTQTEMKLVTLIDDAVIRKCVREALDKNLIWIDETQRVRISSKAQYVIDYFLMGKNFLYE
jgi:hypothetical protein